MIWFLHCCKALIYVRDHFTLTKGSNCIYCIVCTFVCIIHFGLLAQYIYKCLYIYSALHSYSCNLQVTLSTFNYAGMSASISSIYLTYLYGLSRSIAT